LNKLLNEFLERIRKNFKALAAAFAVLLLVSALIGLFAGMARKRSMLEKRTLEKRTATAPKVEESRRGVSPKEAAGEGSAAGGQKPGGSPSTEAEMFLPPPALPEIAEGYSGFTFILDRARTDQAPLEAAQSRISELLKHKKADMQTGLKPFVLDNEEYDILMKYEEPSEP